MMGTEIFKIDASWAEKLTKTRVSFLMTPTVGLLIALLFLITEIPYQNRIHMLSNKIHILALKSKVNVCQ